MKCGVALYNLKAARTVASMGTATHLQLKDILINLYNSLHDVFDLKWPADCPQDLDALMLVGKEYTVRGIVEATVRGLIKVLQVSLLDPQSAVLDVALRRVWCQLQAP